MSDRIATERLWLTEDNEVVPDGDPAARILLCAEGDEIPEPHTAPSVKKAAPARNKKAAPASNKSDED